MKKITLTNYTVLGKVYANRDEALEVLTTARANEIARISSEYRRSGHTVSLAKMLTRDPVLFDRLAAINAEIAALDKAPGVTKFLTFDGEHHDSEAEAKRHLRTLLNRAALRAEQAYNDHDERLSGFLSENPAIVRLVFTILDDFVVTESQ